MSNPRPLQAADSRPLYRMAHFSSRGEFRVRSIGEAVVPSRPLPCGPLGSNLCCDDPENIPGAPSLGPPAEVSQSPTRGRQRACRRKTRLARPGSVGGGKCGLSHLDGLVAPGAAVVSPM